MCLCLYLLFQKDIENLLKCFYQYSLDTGLMTDFYFLLYTTFVVFQFFYHEYVSLTIRNEQLKA